MTFCGYVRLVAGQDDSSKQGRQQGRDTLQGYCTYSHSYFVLQLFLFSYRALDGPGLRLAGSASLSALSQECNLRRAFSINPGLSLVVTVNLALFKQRACTLRFLTECFRAVANQRLKHLFCLHQQQQLCLCEICHR